MKQTSTTKDADTQANTTTTTTAATSQRQQQQQQQSPPPPLPPLPSALTSVHAGGSGAAEVTQFQRSDWIRRLFPPKYKVQVVADSVQQLEPSNVEEIFHASEIVVAWLNSSTTTAATSSASSSSSSSSSPAASSSISSVLGRGLTLDDVFALSVYTFDFGSDGQNERSPQNVLNRALSLRTTVELLRIRAFLFNFLAALRKLPRFRMDPAGGPAAPSLFVPIAKDGFLGGFDLAAMVDSSHRPKVSPGTAGIAIVPSLSYGSGVDSYESFYSQCSATLSRNVSCDSGAAVTTAKEEEENDGGGGDDDDAVLEREERRLVGTVFVCPSFITAYTTRVAARNRLSAQEAAQSRESFSYHNPNVECVVAGTLVEVVCGSALWHYDVQPFAVFPAEGSVLLEADRVFRVLAITHSRGLRTIRVAAVDTPVLLQDILPPRGEIIIRNSQKAPPPPPPPLPPQRYEGGPIPNFVSSAIYWATKNTEFHYFDPQTMLYVVYPDVDASKSDIIFSASTAATVVPAPPGSSYEDEDEEEEGGNGYYDGGYGGKDENSEYSDEDDENEEEEEEEEVWADDFVYSSGEGSSKGVHKSPVNYYNRNSGRGGRRGVISKVAEGASSLISAVSNYKGSGVIESDSDNSDGLSEDEDGEEHASDDDDDNNDNNNEGNGSSSSSSNSNSNSNYYNNNEEEEEEEENSEDEEDEEEDGCIVEVMPENSPKKRLEKLVFALNAQDLTPAQAAARCQELEEFTAANWQEPYFNELFLRLRGVESLLNIVRFLPPEQETFGAICGTLARVRCKSDDAFVEGNTVYLLLEAFELFFGDRTICAHYLQMVCANFGERAVEAAAGIGSVLVYLRALDCHYDAPEVCEAAFRLLVLFAKHSSDTVAVIARAMRVESLFCFVKKYAESVPIVNQIFGVFALLTNTIPDYDRLLVDHGIIPLLTAYIRRQHKYEHDATCYFCAMATRLTPNESYRQRLISEGCGRAVRQLITDNITNVNLCVSCCSLLEVLTRKTSKKGAQQQQQQQSPQLTSQGTGGGHGHGNSNGNGMITGYSSSGSSAGTSFLTQLLGANKNDPVTARSICLSLKFFLEFDKDKCLAFTQNGGMSMLMKILRRSNNSSPEAGVGTDLQATACALLYSVFNTCSEDPTALTAELRKFLAEFPAAVSPYMASIEFALKACSIYYVIAAKYVPQCAMPDGKTIELLLRAVHGHMKSIMVCQYALSTIEKFHEYAPRLVERPEYLDLFLEVLRTYTRRSDAICAKAIVLVAYVARASDANAVLHKSLTDTLTAVNAHVGSDAVKGAFCILLDALLERDPSIKSSLVKTGLENIIRNLNLPASTMARCKTLIREGLMSAPPVPAIRKDLISTAATSSSSSSSNSHRERTLYAIEGGDSYGGKRAHGMKRKRGRGSLGGKRARKSAQKRSDNSGNGGSNSNDVYSDEDSLEEDDDSCYYNDGSRDGRRTVTAASAPANGADSFRDEDEDEDEDYDYYYDERDEDDGDGSESDEDEGSRGACSADCGYCGSEEVSKDVLEELIKQFASTDAAEVKRATGVVKQLVQRSDVLKVLSIGLGVTQAGFAAIEQHPADTGVCDNVIYIFQILSKARDSCAIFLENGGLESLTRLAEHNDVSFRTCAHACAVLCSYVGSGLLASLHIDPVRYLAVVARAVGRLADTDSRGFICEHLCAAACSGLASTPPADIAAFIEPHLPMLLNIVCAKTASQRSCRAVFELFHLYANSVVKGALDTLAVRRNAARFVEAAERTLDFYYTTPEVCEPVARLICALADIDPTACTARRRNLCTKLAHTVEANTENRNIVLFGISAIFHVCNFYNDYRPAQAQEQSSKSGQKKKPSSTPASGEAEPESKTKTKVEGATADAEETQNHSNSSSSAVAEDKKCSEDEEYEEGKNDVNDDEAEEEEEEEEDDDDDDDDVCYIFSQCYQLFMKVFQQIFDIPQMCRLFLKYLDFLTNSDHMAQLLLQNGDGVQTIVLGLARCSSNLSLCVKLAVALCGVAKRKPNGAELVLANGGLGAMMALVRTHPASKDVAQLFCYVLCLFTAKVVNATYVGSFSECADILIDTFRRFKDDSTVCDLFCSAAKKLIPVGQSVAKFANSTFLALLLGVMKAPATSQKLCESLAGLLCMIEYPTQDREFLAAFVAGLFDVMAAHSSSEVLLNECTLILSSLAEHDSDCCCSLIATEERIRALLGVFAAVQKTDTRESICLIIASIIEKAPPNWGSPSPSSNSSLSPSPQQQQQQQTQTQQQQQQPTKKEEEDTKKKRKKKGRKEESNNNNNSCGNAAPATAGAAAAAVTTTSHQGTLSAQPQQLSLLQPSNVNGSRAVAKFIGENGGVALILGFMEAHLESAFMCDKPVRALQALARYPPNAVQIIDSGVERILAKCVQGIDSERKVQLQKFYRVVVSAKESLRMSSEVSSSSSSGAATLKT